MRIPWLIGSYKGRSSAANLSECLNLMAELDLFGGRERLTWFGRPGLKKWCDIGTGEPVRALEPAFGKLYAACDSGLYEIDTDANATKVGSLSTATGKIHMSHNLTQVAAVDGIFGYVYTPSSGKFTKLSDPGFQGADRIVEQDGYFIVNQPGTGYFQVSGLNDGLTWNGLDYANAEGYPDNVVSLLSFQRRLWIPGEDTTEVWYNSSGSFPFSRINGATSGVGCAAAQSLVSLDNSVFMLTSDRQVVRFSGYTPVVISTRQVDYQFSGYSKVSDAVAHAVVFQGHPLYILTFPAEAKTWVYDASSQLWSEWSSYSTVTRRLDNVFRGYSYARFNGKHLFGDHSNGIIYQFRSDYYTDYDRPILRRGTGQILHEDGKKIEHNELELVFEPGVGLESEYVVDTDGRYVMDTDGNYVTQASMTSDATPVPYVSISYTDDNGKSWSVPRILSVGQQGDSDKRVVLRRLGASYNRAYRVEMSDPVKWVLLSAYLTGRVLK